MISDRAAAPPWLATPCSPVVDDRLYGPGRHLHPGRQPAVPRATLWSAPALPPIWPCFDRTGHPLTLVLPNYAQAVHGPSYSDRQLMFVAVMTLLLYAAFLYIQTVRHREYFITLSEHASNDSHPIGGRMVDDQRGAAAGRAGRRGVAVQEIPPTWCEYGREAIGAPPAVTRRWWWPYWCCCPKASPAYQSARRDELQKALNLALGSSLATIGLTFPAVTVLSLTPAQTPGPGPGPWETVLMTLTLVVSIVTLGSGRTNVLYGFVHLVIFATFIFVTFCLDGLSGPMSRWTASVTMQESRDGAD